MSVVKIVLREFTTCVGKHGVFGQLSANSASAKKNQEFLLFKWMALLSIFDRPE